jgi:MSHA pilin protein MshD
MFKGQRGVTLVELIVTIVILSIALVGLSFAISLGIGQSANTLFELRAVALGQAYLDEILSKKFDEDSRNSGIPPCVDPALSGRACSNPLITEEGSRTNYDDVDDYDGLDEGLNGTGPLRDAQGNLRSGYDNFRVQVSVRRIAVGVGQEEEFPTVNPVTNPKPDDAYDAKLIVVTVSDGSADGIKFSTYKSNF